MNQGTMRPNKAPSNVALVSSCWNEMSTFLRFFTGKFNAKKNPGLPGWCGRNALAFTQAFCHKAPEMLQVMGELFRHLRPVRGLDPRSHGVMSPRHIPEVFFAGTSVLRRHKRMEPGNTKTSGVLTTRKIGVLRQSRKKYIPNSRNDC